MSGTLTYFGNHPDTPSTWDHAENEDKHLISHVASIINNNNVPVINNSSRKITSSEDRHCLISNYQSVRLEGETQNQIFSISSNISNKTNALSILSINDHKYHHYYYASLFVNSFYYYYNINQGDLESLINDYTKILQCVVFVNYCLQSIISPVTYIFYSICYDFKDLVSEIEQYQESVESHFNCYITGIHIQIQCLKPKCEVGKYAQNFQVSIKACSDEFKSSISSDITKLKSIKFDLMTLMSMLLYLKNCNCTLENHVVVLQRVSKNLNNLGHITFYINIFYYSLVSNIEKLKWMIYKLVVFCCYLNYYLGYICCLKVCVESLCSKFKDALKKLKAEVEVKIQECKCKLQCYIKGLKVDYKCEIPSPDHIYCCIDKTKDSLACHLLCLSQTLLYSLVFLFCIMCHTMALYDIQKKMKEVSCLMQNKINKFLKCSIKNTTFKINRLNLAKQVNQPSDTSGNGGLGIGLERLTLHLVSKMLQVLLLSYMAMTETRVYWLYLTQRIFRYYRILNILSKGTRDCCCDCCFQYSLKCKKIEMTEFPKEHYRSSKHHLEFYMTSTTENHGNNFCLCLVTKYVLFRNVRMVLCYMRDLVGDLYSTVSRRFDKYTQSTTHLMSVGKMIMLIISIVYRITLWMKKKYLCTCPLGCPCIKNGNCSFGCQVCVQPQTKCCTCPKLPKNCTNGGNQKNSAQNNNGCTCKCKNGQPSCRCCSSLCGSNQCCRCCCNCFCRNLNDPYYPYLVSITLYLSSLIENIWATDNRSIVSGIHSLSSLVSEYQSIHVYTNYSSESLCRIYPLIVDKKCGQEPTKKCCCWCVTCYNVLLAYIYLCFGCALCKALCKNSETPCKKIEEYLNIDVGECTCNCLQNKGLCCLFKLALCSQICNSIDLQELLKKCCTECAQEGSCCKKISETLAAGGDLILIGCKCESGGKDTKTSYVLFKNPWGGRNEAVLLVCKCQDQPKCCCLTKVIDKIKEELKTLCAEDCKCQEIKTKLDEICNNGCCGTGCPCEQLKEKLTEICKDNNCLCEKIKALKDLCTKPDCQCKEAEECCRCVCCKLAVAGVRVLTRACRQNFLEPYKRIVIDLISSSPNKVEVMETIVNKINSGTLNVTYLVKNNYSTHFNTYTDHKNIANRFPSLTMEMVTC